jgi:HD-GYP domain-containing protein (c-di-GMP phosphodiesterase class II)
MPTPVASRQVSRRTVLSAADCLVRALEARDPNMLGHSWRVRTYSLRLADALGLVGRRRRQLGLAAQLHDIGKVGIPDEVLNKKGPLTARETDQVRAHPIIGERILAPIIRSRTVRSAIRGHHERYDGMGYPDGLAGEDIPLLARVIAVADCFDALTSARTYREALPRPLALELIHAGAGGQFDPVACAAFLGLFRKT